MAETSGAVVASVAVKTTDGRTLAVPAVMFPDTAGGRTVPVPRWAGIGIFLILLFAGVAAARDFLLPITMSLLLFFVFTPFRRRLSRRGVPDWITATIITAALLLGLFALLWLLMGPAGQMIADAPQIMDQLEQKFAEFRAQFRGLEDAAVTLGAPADAAEGAGASVVMGVVNFTPVLVGQLIFVLVLLFFLITAGDLMYLKVVQSFDSIGDKRRAYQALRQIEDSLGSYLGTITVINIALGLVMALAFWLMGMPAPGLFGVTAALLNYVPYVGLIIGALSATAVALVSMDGYVWPLTVGAVYVVINSIEGQAITPYFLSRKLEMNTVVVFIAVALWAWLWSVVGMIVAVPILVVVRVLFEHIPGMAKVANFIAGEQAPPVPDDEDEEAPATPAEVLGASPV